MPATSSGNISSTEMVEGEIAFTEAVTGSPLEGHANQPELTPRQRQILELLQAGKVNKEIASELGIGVGTVKQHVVALFKRLNVRNRTMAVSRGMSLLQPQQAVGGTMVVDGLLERRPCIVLSIALPEGAEHRAVRFLHGFLAALAYDHDALFLARKGNAGDLIFGVQRVTEYDLIKALQTAFTIHSDIAGQFPELAELMQGGLTAGLAVASMKRFGGWSGEAVASAAIGLARELAGTAPSGKILVGQDAQEVMKSFGIGAGADISAPLPFSCLDALHWTGERSRFALVGRERELNVLQAALGDATRGMGRWIYLRGEAGMGKSRLCQEISRLCREAGGELHWFQGQPDLVEEKHDGNLSRRSTQLFEALLVRLRSVPEKYPELVVIDDFHLLEKQQQDILWETIGNSVNKGRMVIVAARRYAESALSQATLVQLGKLSRDELATLVGVVLDGGAGSMPIAGVEGILDKAAGVPLFAVELAKFHGEWKKVLSLMIVVTSRLDNLRLDRRLLNAVARNSGKTTLKEIAAALDEDIADLRRHLDRAEASGVVLVGPDGRLLISHPLLRQLIEYLDME